MPSSVGVGHDVEQRSRHACSAALVVAVVDEEHVDVARVVELTPAELSHPDHRERERVGMPRLPGDGERGLEAHLRERGQLPPHRREVGGAEQVAGGDAQELASLPPTKSPFVGGFDVAPRARGTRRRSAPVEARRDRGAGRAASRRRRPPTTTIATHTPTRPSRRAASSLSRELLGDLRARLDHPSHHRRAVGASAERSMARDESPHRRAPFRRRPSRQCRVS